MLLILLPIRESEPANRKIEITAVREYARSQVPTWQWFCLDQLWDKESSWKNKKRPWLAVNRSSGAYGIPQSLPAKKMKEIADDYRFNPYTQVDWGIKYINERYGDPCVAWNAHKQKGWY